MTERNSEKIIYTDDIQRIAIVEKDFKLPLSRDIGSFLLTRGIYSKGNDFTSLYAKDNIDYVGDSHLKKLYLGSTYQMYPDKKYTDITLWLIHRNEALIGVVCLEHGSLDPQMSKEYFHDQRKVSKEQIPVVNMGMISCFLLPSHRGKGILKQFNQRFLIPKFEQLSTEVYQSKNALPYLIATDASVNLLEGYRGVLIDVMYPCVSQTTELWKSYRKAIEGYYPVFGSNEFSVRKSLIQKPKLSIA